MEPQRKVLLLNAGSSSLKFSLLESALPEYDVAGIIRERAGTSLPGIAPSNTYRSSDGSYIVIGGNSDAIFKRLMRLIGRPELAEDPRYRTNKERAKHAAELDALIDESRQLRAIFWQCLKTAKLNDHGRRR